MRVFLLVFAFVILCLVFVKNSSRPKPPNYHNHRDHESHSSSVHEETIIPTHHYHHSFKGHPAFNHEYRDLVQPSSSLRQELLNYPEQDLESYRQSLYSKPEGEVQDYRQNLYGKPEILDYRQQSLYKPDAADWAPISHQNLIRYQTSYESEPSQAVPRKKKKRKPIVEQYIELTTSKPKFFHSGSNPPHYEHFATFDKIQKGANRPTRVRNSYEVHEETDDVQAPGRFNNLAPITYSFRDNTVATADVFPQDATYGIKVKGARKPTRRPY